MLKTLPRVPLTSLSLRLGLLLALLAGSLTYQMGPLHERSWHEQSIGKIPPGRTHIVSHWMERLRENGVDFPNASLMAQQIVLYERQERDERGRSVWKGRAVFFERRGHAGGMASTRSFQIRAYGDYPDVEDKGLAEKIASVLIGLDKGRFFKSTRGERYPAEAVHAQPEPETLVRASLEFLLWWLFLVLVFLLGPRALLGPRSWSKESWVFLGLSGLAIGLRLSVESGAIHANEHAVREVGALFPASMAPGDAWPDGGYGYGASGFFRFLALLTGSTDSTVFHWMGVAMGLATPLVGWGVRALGGSQARSYLAALVYALTPILIRSAPTESTLVLSVLLMLASLVSFKRAKEEGEVWSAYWWLSGACAVLAVQMHVVTIVWMLPVVLAPFWLPENQRRAAWLVVGTCCVLCAPHLIHTIDHIVLGEVDAPNPFERMIQQWGHAGIAPLNPFLAPFGLTVLALASISKWRYKPALVAAAIVGAYLLLSVSTTQTLSDVLRYQSALTLLVIVCALLGPEAFQRREQAAKGLPSAVLIVVVAATFFPTMQLLATPDPEARIVGLVEEAAEDGLLDEGLVVLRTEERKRTKLQPARPSWALPAQAPRQVVEGAPLLLTSGCVIQPDEGAREKTSLDRGCRKGLGGKLSPIRTIGVLPEGFAGLPLWFHPRRPGAPSPGIYRRP